MEQFTQIIKDYLVSQFTGMDFWGTIQVIGLILSFVYLILEFEQKVAMWIVSAISSVIYACVYFNSKIYADMAFCCFNVCLCVYGFYKWYRNDANDNSNSEDKGEQITYTHFTSAQLVKTLITGILIWSVIFLILEFFTDSPIPALDSITTTLNIVGTWVLAQKIIEVWGIWFIVNLISIYIYCKRDLHFSTIFLYIFYLLASVYGYLRWKIKGIETNAAN